MSSRKNEENLQNAAKNVDIATAKELLRRGTNLDATDNVSTIS